MTKRSEIYWAIDGRHGLYIGTWCKRIDAIAGHVHQRFRETESPWPDGRKLYPMQKEDWEKCKSAGDRAVKVRVTIMKSR